MTLPFSSPTDPLEPDPPPNVPSAEDIERAAALRRRIERELLKSAEPPEPAAGSPAPSR